MKGGNMEIVWIPDLFEKYKVVKLYDDPYDEVPRVLSDVTEAPNAYGVLFDEDGTAMVALVALTWDDPVETVDGLPHDWGRYSQFGCDSNGGNYCPSWSLWVYKGRLFVEFTTSREYFPGDRDKYICFGEDGMYVVEEQPYEDFSLREDCIPTRADTEVYEIEDYKNWEDLKRSLEEEWEAYYRWLEEE